MRKSIVLFVTSILFVSCATLIGINMKNINVGMHRNEVFAKTKSFSPKVIGTKTYSDGIIEVVQISEYPYRENEINHYWIFIFNEKVIAWQPITALEWQSVDFDFKVDKVYYDMKQK